jgi:8-oxo-dGTP pyrophosphatase MutT (NUDIX family)
MIEPAVVPVERLDLCFSPRPWRFAEERRVEIDAYFATLRRATPALWNGRVLLLADAAVGNAALGGAYFVTDFASFIAWRDWDFPDPSIRNCFSMGALRTADGAFLLGVMAERTANAGKIYFPSGTPDLNDVVGGRVDLERNVRRELAEETGLTGEDFAAEPGWCAVFAGARIAVIKVLQARKQAVELRRRILAHIRREREPELADIRVVRGPADFDPMMPPFIVAFLNHAWR